MVVVYLQLAPWYKPYEITQKRGGEQIEKNQFKLGDWLLIKSDLGTDLGKVIKIEEKEEDQISEESKKRFILRKANSSDLKRIKERNFNKKEIIDECERLAKKRNLSMKIIDALFSFDGSKIIFAFTAPHRVDFRDLVKDLVQKFHKSIRMHQVGVRQETCLAGDIGPCGRCLCCSFLKDLGNVTTEMMFNQQLSQRGPERLSGVCGRLKCCLAFENEEYKKLREKLPPIGKEIKIKKGKGKVVDWNILKQTVRVEILDKSDSGKTFVEIPLTELK